MVCVKRLTKKRNGNIEPINTYLLTYGMSILPSNIKVGLYQMKFEMFIPNPLLALNVSVLVMDNICAKVQKPVLSV